MKPNAHWRRFLSVILSGLILGLSPALAPARAADDSPLPAVQDMPSTTDAASLAAFQADVAALIAANPDGGAELEAALGTLVAAQPDGALAVATLMVAMGGDASAALVLAVSNAMLSAAPFTPDQLAAAVATAVAGAVDPMAAAAGVIASAAALPPSLQVAVGSGLARASATLAASGNAAAATSITAAVAASPITAMSQSFTSMQDTIAGVLTNQSTTVTTGTTQEQESVPENPASSS